MFSERLVNLRHSVKLLCDKIMKIKREVTDRDEVCAVLYLNYQCLSPIVNNESVGKKETQQNNWLNDTRVNQISQEGAEQGKSGTFSVMCSFLNTKSDVINVNICQFWYAPRYFSLFKKKKKSILP